MSRYGSPQDGRPRVAQLGPGPRVAKGAVDPERDTLEVVGGLDDPVVGDDRQPERAGQRRRRLLGPLQRGRGQVGDVRAGEVVGDPGGHRPAGRGQPVAGQPAVEDVVGVLHLAVPQQVNQGLAHPRRPGGADSGAVGTPELFQVARVGARSRRRSAARPWTSGSTSTSADSSSSAASRAAPAAAVIHGPEYLVIGVDVCARQERREGVGPDAMPEQQPGGGARQHGEDPGGGGTDQLPRRTGGPIADQFSDGRLGRCRRRWRRPRLRCWVCRTCRDQVAAGLGARCGHPARLAFRRAKKIAPLPM